jgi:hypothetical protein
MVDRFVGIKGELRNWLQSLHPVVDSVPAKKSRLLSFTLLSNAAKFITGRTLSVEPERLSSSDNSRCEY